MLSVNIPTHGHNHNFDNQAQIGMPFWPPKKKKKNLLPFLDRKNGDKYWCNRSELCMSLCWQTKVLYLHFKWKNTWLQTSPIVFQLLCMQASQIITRFKISGLNFVPLISCMRRNSRNLCSANFQFFWRIRRKVQVWTLAANLTSRKHGTRANCFSDFLFFHFLKLKC